MEIHFFVINFIIDLHAALGEWNFHVQRKKTSKFFHVWTSKMKQRGKNGFGFVCLFLGKVSDIFAYFYTLSIQGVNDTRATNIPAFEWAK